MSTTKIILTFVSILLMMESGYSQCLSLFLFPKSSPPPLEFENVELARAPEKLNEAARKIGIERKNILTISEAFSQEINPAEKIKVVLSQEKALEPSKAEPGELRKQTNRGLAIIKASPQVTLEKSKALASQFSSVKDVNVFTNLPKYIDRFKQRGLIDDKHERENSYVKVPTSEVLKEFFKELASQVELTKPDLEYLSLVLENMIQSADMVSAEGKSPRKKHLIGLRMRWNPEDSKREADTIHTDPDVDFVSTLALIGKGTEVFYFADNKVEVRVAGNNEISHIEGRTHLRPVLHRASTKEGARLVILLFWE